MKKTILFPLILSLGGCNAAFIETVNQQLADGYKWVSIPCRSANPDRPSVTIDTPRGQKLVCTELRK